MPLLVNAAGSGFSLSIKGYWGADDELHEARQIGTRRAVRASERRWGEKRKHVRYEFERNVIGVQ